jgi:hypothetical protein
MTVALAFSIVAFILDKGLPAWVALSNAWAKKDPTMKDFEALMAMMKRPEDF